MLRHEATGLGYIFCGRYSVSSSLFLFTILCIWFSVINYPLFAFRDEMDPFSVSMAIVGLLSASWKISEILSPLISKGKNAPDELREIKMTVDTIRSKLSQLQLMLLGRMKVARERTSLILVNQIVVNVPHPPLAPPCLWPAFYTKNSDFGALISL